MPEKKKADADLTAFVNAKQAEIKKKGEAAQAKYALYQKKLLRKPKLKTKQEVRKCRNFRKKWLRWKTK
ncbi:hypothetical protein [Chryseobacterium sp. 3008163]|uniref:hypothetical protein n=1 Tax=Chryseobacterium sp. 3008163 TaxID=2478663 RepID=UPI0021D10B89|nr:hypothetical protein [Chryseobacterium sp. 3008163]